MITDDSAGVVLFRLRPARSDANTAVAYMRTIQNKHAALTIPSVRAHHGQAQELNIWTFKGAAPTAEPTGMTRSVLVPSIYKDGVHSLSFTRVEKESAEARTSFDCSSLMSLQHVFDMHCDKEITQSESEEDRLIVTAIYILAIRTAVDYYDKAGSTMPEMHEKMATVMAEHDEALRVAGVDVEAIDQFIRGCGVMATTLCVTAFKVNPQYMCDARRQLAMSGMASILRTHMKMSKGVYLGVDIVDDSKRELRMLAAYTRFSKAIENALERDSISMSIQECLLGKKDTISKTLRMHAIEISPHTKCQVCDDRVAHFAISVGRCHLCPYALDITCEKCVGNSCTVCDEQSTVVDFERTALVSVTRACIIMRENNKLRTEVEGNKAKHAKSHLADKKIDELKKEVDRLTMENSDMRMQAKRERRADKRGSKDVCSVRELERISDENASAKTRLEVENASLVSTIANLEETCAVREATYVAIEARVKAHEEEMQSRAKEDEELREQSQDLDADAEGELHDDAEDTDFRLRYNQLLGQIKAKDDALNKLLARITTVSAVDHD